MNLIVLIPGRNILMEAEQQFNPTKSNVSTCTIIIISPQLHASVRFLLCFPEFMQLFKAEFCTELLQSGVCRDFLCLKESV